MATRRRARIWVRARAAAVGVGSTARYEQLIEIEIALFLPVVSGIFSGIDESPGDRFRLASLGRLLQVEGIRQDSSADSPDRAVAQAAAQALGACEARCRISYIPS